MYNSGVINLRAWFGSSACPSPEGLADGGKRIREQKAFAALWKRWEVIVEGFRPVGIKHRDENSTWTQQPGMSLVAIDSAVLSNVSYMGRTTVF
jgi:hypothetical protein